MKETRSMMRLYGMPIGVSFTNGQGKSGIFCGVRQNYLQLIEYLYKDYFELKLYKMEEIDAVIPFPPCHRMPTPVIPNE